VKNALSIIAKNESYKLINKEKIIKSAIFHTQNNGIVFLDEIDKIVSSKNKSNIDVSRQGVQRDILPIIEGSDVTTDYGIVNTRNILFISAGAFHSSSISDFMPELQGRFPIRAFLNNLTEKDFFSILYESENSLIKQYQLLLASDHILLNFKKSGIKQISKVAKLMNINEDNIGARRLYSVIENLIENESFYSNINKKHIKIVNIDKKYVNNKVYNSINKTLLSNIL
jgi:ATP-dependent HslUV protease ATP-binding subunit HslU